MSSLATRPPSLLATGLRRAVPPPAIPTARRHRRHGHRSRRAASSIEPLPQNTTEVLALPSPKLSPLEAVAAQLDSLSDPQLDTPWPLHGVAVAYAFCSDAGALELSRYFAPMSTSLYHQDHFQGKFLTRFPGLVGHGGWEVEEEQAEEDGVAVVRVRVVPAAAAQGGGAGGGAGGEQRQTYVFVMVRAEQGLRKGSWMTKQLVRLGADGKAV